MHERAMHRSDTTSSLQRREHPAAKRRRRANRGLASLAFLGAMLWSVVADAQTAPHTGRATIDTNGDRALDEQELRAAVAASFKAADADADGYLTADEARAARMAGDVERMTRGLGALLGARGRNAETATERFARLDADGDGRISQKEFVDAPHPLLRFDADGDGRVTREEI